MIDFFHQQERGFGLKLHTKIAPWLEWRQKIRRWTGNRWVELALQTLGTGGTAFLLAGATAAGELLPLSVCLAAALGLGFPSFGAYIGGCLGYVAFFGVDAAMEPMAVGLLVEACLCIFGEDLFREHRWFATGCVMAFTAMVGVLFLLQNRYWVRLLWRYLMKIAVAGLGTEAFRRIMDPNDQRTRVLLPVCLCAGLCAIQPVGFPLGLAAGCTLAAAAAGTPMAVLAAVLYGLALDLSWGGGNCTAVLTLAALSSRWQPMQIPRLGLWLLGAGLGVLLTAGNSLLLAGAMLGVLLSPLVPAERLFGTPLGSPRTADPRLRLASGLLEQLSQCMAVPRAERPDPETNTVFDHAADRVCRHCSQWELCWETEISPSRRDMVSIRFVTPPQGQGGRIRV